MRTAFGFLSASALALALAGAWPRAGHPVLLAFPPGADGGGAFGVDGWRVQNLSEAGPFRLVVATPLDGAASPTRFAVAAGALLVLAARPMAACAPVSRRT